MNNKTSKSTVVLICTNMNERGGKCRHFANLYKYLSQEFKIVIFICSKVEDKIREFMLKNGVVDEDLVFLSRTNKWLIIPLIFEIRDKLLNKQVNIVNTFDLQSDIFGAIAARLAGIKKIYALFESRAIPENTPFIKMVFYRVMNMAVKGLFVKTAVVSEGLRREVLAENLRDPGSIAVIHLGFSLPDGYRDKEWIFDKLRQGRPLIGTISRLSSEKGLDRFLKAIPLVLKAFPEANFTIIGKGLEENRLKVMAGELGLVSKVIFKDWTDDVFGELSKIDIFVMPSLREGCPNSLLEALALSRPIVASKIEGIAELIIDEYNGLLVDTSCPKEFAERIIYLCKNPEEAILLGKNGQNKVKLEFTISGEIEAFLSLYRCKCEIC